MLSISTQKACEIIKALGGNPDALPDRMPETLLDETVRLISESGGGSGYVLPAATVQALGGVKKAAAVADLSDAPTKENFNALLASLRAAGILSE